MISFDVVGTPAPQGSKTAMMIGGKPRVIEGSSKTGRANHKTWRQAVMTAGQEWLLDNPQPPLDGPLKLVIAFRMPRPDAARFRSRHSTKPDLSKLIRSTEDSLKDAQLIRDDSRIFSLQASKWYVQPGQLPGALVIIDEEALSESHDLHRLKQRAKEERLKLKS